jgi:BASS family bile acid:Na+ symporter
MLLRHLLRRRMASSMPLIDGINVLILLLFAIPIMDGVTGHLANAPWRTLGFVLWASLMTAFFIVAMGLAFWPLGRRFALTAAYGGGSRNNALLLAILPATVDPDYFLFIAAVQVPIYTVPSVMQPICRWLLRNEAHRIAPAD